MGTRTPLAFLAQRLLKVDSPVQGPRLPDGLDVKGLGGVPGGVTLLQTLRRVGRTPCVPSGGWRRREGHRTGLRTIKPRDGAES